MNSARDVELKKKKKVEMQNAKNVDVRHAKQTDLINNFINEKKKVLTSF